MAASGMRHPGRPVAGLVDGLVDGLVGDVRREQGLLVRRSSSPSGVRREEGRPVAARTTRAARYCALLVADGLGSAVRCARRPAARSRTTAACRRRRASGSRAAAARPAAWPARPRSRRSSSPCTVRSVWPRCRSPWICWTGELADPARRGRTSPAAGRRAPPARGRSSSAASSRRCMPSASSASCVGGARLGREVLGKRLVGLGSATARAGRPRRRSRRPPRRRAGRPRRTGCGRWPARAPSRRWRCAGTAGASRGAAPRPRRSRRRPRASRRARRRGRSRPG